MAYIKCPRCDLNYIQEEEEYCDVCKAELKMGPKLLFANDDDEDISEETELCPVCKQNYIRNNEAMCKICLQEMASRRDDVDIDIDKDEEWRAFLDDDKDDDLGEIPEGLSEISEDFEEEEEDSYTGEKTPVFEEPDDFDLGPVDESDFEDREEEEELEDEEDELE